MYSVLVVTLQTKRRMNSPWNSRVELHDYHTKSEMAQHEIVELTTFITNLRLTDTWKGMMQHSLHISRINCIFWIVEESNKILRLHASFFSNKWLSPFLTFAGFTSFMGTVWHQKTGSSSTLHYQSYYDLLAQECCLP